MLVFALITTVFAAEPAPAAAASEALPAEASPANVGGVDQPPPPVHADGVSPDLCRIPLGVGWSGFSTTLTPSAAASTSSVEPEAGRHGAMEGGGSSLRRFGAAFPVAPAQLLGPVPTFPEVVWRGAPGIILPGSDRPWWVR